MAKSSGNWIKPTPISNRFSSLQQEDDLVNQSTPDKEEDTLKPLPFILQMSLPSLHYFNYLIKSSQSFMKSKLWHKIRLKSNLNLLTLTALSQNPLLIEIRHFIHTNLRKNVHIELC
jgi:hypothetical protein